MATKLRILCLHGYRQNEKSFRQKTGGLRKSMKSVAEFVFVRAPHAVYNEEDSFSWFNSNPSTHNTLTYKCEETEDPGFEESVQFLEEHIKNNGPYDGILAFSQGACLAAMLCSMKRANPVFEDLGFVVLFSGFRSRVTKHNKYYECVIDTVRSLHVQGENDAAIPLEMSEKLAASFFEPNIFKHPGGHFVPSSLPVRTACKEFLLEEMKRKGGVT